MFIILATVHWIGCIYFVIAILSGFSTETYSTNWVDAWTSKTHAAYTWGEDSILFSYIVIAFKGFSMLTNLGYEVTVPERQVEMVVAIISQNIKVVINAYILGTALAASPREVALSERCAWWKGEGLCAGTLFHFLVKKDPEMEATKDLMETLHVYCTERRLPAELQKKIRAYLDFQQQHSSAVAEHVTKVRALAVSRAFACELVHLGTVGEDTVLCRGCHSRCETGWPSSGRCPPSTATATSSAIATSPFWAASCSRSPRCTSCRGSSCSSAGTWRASSASPSRAPSSSPTARTSSWSSSLARAQPSASLAPSPSSWVRAPLFLPLVF